MVHNPMNNGEDTFLFESSHLSWSPKAAVRFPLCSSSCEINGNNNKRESGRNPVLTFFLTQVTKLNINQIIKLKLPRLVNELFKWSLS